MLLVYLSSRPSTILNSSLINPQSSHLNVGTGTDITIKELAKVVSSIVGYEGNIIWDSSKPDGTPRKLLDVSKMNKMGWTANTELKEGIKFTLDSYIQQVYKNKIRN